MGEYVYFSSDQLSWRGHTIAPLFLSRGLDSWCYENVIAAITRVQFIAESNSCLFPYWPVPMLFICVYVCCFSNDKLVKGRVLIPKPFVSSDPQIQGSHLLFFSYCLATEKWIFFLLSISCVCVWVAPVGIWWEHEILFSSSWSDTFFLERQELHVWYRDSTY